MQSSLPKLNVFSYQQATLEHAISLSTMLRPEDELEVSLGSGRPVEEVLVDSVGMSEVAESVVVDGVVIAIRGISRVGEVGVPWMLCSPAVMRWTKRMVADAIPWVAHYGNSYTVLTNMVHAENTKAIQWLKRIGFTIGPLHKEWGAGKAPFYQFYRYSNNV
jgi:hypothetical protein